MDMATVIIKIHLFFFLHYCWNHVTPVYDQCLWYLSTIQLDQLVFPGMKRQKKNSNLAWGLLLAKISETIWTELTQTGQAVENQKPKHSPNGDLSPPPTSSCCVQCAEPTVWDQRKVTLITSLMLGALWPKVLWTAFPRWTFDRKHNHLSSLF